ncbi:MAG: hypothetical protein J6X68_04905, partial [Lachnospiraceae bacterium]|nr:hypothetical protein [Lachnospiraceae bacterium]
AAINALAEPLKPKFVWYVEFEAAKKTVNQEIKYAVINIVKEAVSNIIKYSRNENVLIKFDEHPSMYQLIIHDHGNAGDIPEHNSDEAGLGKKKKVSKGVEKGSGMGLENIRARAEQLGGQANFSNDNGFRVFVRIPKEV